MDDAQLIAEAEMSPCVGVCQSDAVTGWCFGCGRDKTEIKTWETLGDTEKQALLSPLKERVEQLIQRRREERNKAAPNRRRSRK
jgi:predicted Fe-S protein YdhL (DUF1289 family)